MYKELKNEILRQMISQQKQILKFEINENLIKLGSILYKSQNSVAHYANKKEMVVKSLKWKMSDFVFLNEIIAYEQIQKNGIHDNICEFLGFILHDVESRYMASIVTKCYLFDLHHYVKNVYSKSFRLHNFENDMFLRLAKDILLGMNFLIESKILHRDLKPANIFLQLKDNKLTSKLGDFALATPIYEPNDQASQQRCYGIGTTRFSAPEIYENFYQNNCLFDDDEIYTEKSELFSFGMILYVMFTGVSYPFTNLTNDNVIDLLTASANWDWKPQEYEGDQFFPEPPEEWQALLEDFSETTPKTVIDIFKTCIIAERGRRNWTVKELIEQFSKIIEEDI